MGLEDEVLKHTHCLYTLSQYSTTSSSLQKEANVTHESGECWESNSPSGSSCCFNPPAHTAEKGGHSSPSRSEGFGPTRMQFLLRKLPPRSQTHKLENSEMRERSTSCHCPILLLQALG